MAVGIALATITGGTVLAEDDSITAAKRQLETLKSDANSARASSATGALPSVAVPEMNTGKAEDAPPSQDALLKEAKRRARQEKAAANWLLDAMTKEKSAAAKKSGERGEKASVSERDFDSDWESQEDELERTASEPRVATDAKGLDDGKRTAPPSVVNPFARYMSDWLSPQDYSLLNKTVDVAREANPSREAAPVTPSVSGIDPAFSGLGLIGRPDEKPALPAVKPADNPYLQGFSVPDPVTLSSIPPPQAVPSVPPPAPAPPPVFEPPATKSSLPDFVKPATDDKYFKPLKRF